MQVILSAQDQKDLHYEVECILRMFLPQVRLRFCQEPEAGERESVRITTGGGEGLENTVSLTLGDFSGTEGEPASGNRKDTEAAVCRCLYRLLARAAGKGISWGVLTGIRPVKLVITNYPEGQSETFEVENNPNRPEDGVRTITFSREIYVEAEDFLETPVPKYKRLYPDGPECRLKGAYLIKCTGCRKDENGNVVEIYAVYDPDSRGGNPADGRKVKGATIHWVDAANAVDAEVRLYDYLFGDPAPDAPGKDFLEELNPNSLEILTGCKVERSLAEAPMPEQGKSATAYQFMRQGYFCLDNQDATPGHLVFNRSVSLKDSFRGKSGGKP